MKKDFIISLFAEVNEHLRVTDNKQLTVSLTHFSILAIVLSLIFDKQTSFFQPTVINILIHLFLFFVGIIIYIKQHWYRIWKEHYIDVIYEIVSTWEIDSKFYPYWLRYRFQKSKFTLDKTFIYFSLLLNSMILLLLSIDFIFYFENKFTKIIMVSFLNTFYVSFLLILRYKVNKKINLIA